MAASHRSTQGLSQDFIEPAQPNQTQAYYPAQTQPSYSHQNQYSQPTQNQFTQPIQNQFPQPTQHQAFHQVQNQPLYPPQNQPSFPNQHQQPFPPRDQQHYPAQSQPFYAAQTLHPTVHTRPSYSQSSQQSSYANAPAPANVPAYWPAYQYLYGSSKPPTASKPKGKTKQKYYKPAATESFVLSLFLLATLVFIGGIEYILRRGVPFEADTSTSTNTTIANANATSTARPHKRLNSLGSINLHDSFGQLDYGLVPRQQEPVPSCIGVEVIVSIIDTDQCDASSTQCSSTATYTKPIYNKAIPTMPCYACAMEAQGIQAKGFITATTTHCGACATTDPATIYPCSTCEGTTLSSAPVWQITPTEPPRLYSEYTKKPHSHVNNARTA